MSEIKTERVDDENIDYIDFMDESLIEDFKSESEVDFESSYTKCGDIMIDGRNILLSCAFCNEQLIDLEKFKEHVIQKHLSDDDFDSNASSRNDTSFKCDENNIEVTEDQSATDFMLNEEENNSQTNTTIKGSPETQDFLTYFHNFVQERTIHKENFEDHNKVDVTEGDINCIEADVVYDPIGDYSDFEGNSSYKDDEETPVGGYCEICDRTFRSIQGYKKHKIRHEVVSDIEENEELFIEGEILDNSRTEDEVEPEKSANNSKTSSKHEIKVSSLKCKFCGKQFRDRERRKHHERIHTGELPFECPICPKRFRAERFRDIHARIHSEERPYKCLYCPQAFKHRMNLTVHIRSHTGEKRFECSYCGKRFVRNVDCRVHIRTHTGEKPFQCEQCGRRFTTSSKLLDHGKRHSNTRPFECEICSKRFFSRSLLKNHKVVHSNERPFECEICFETFPRRRALLAHVKIHSDHKEYICKLCGKAFSQNAGLYCHMRTHGVQKMKK